MATKTKNANLELVDAEQHKKQWAEFHDKRDAACAEHRKRQEKASIGSGERRVILADYLNELEDMSTEFHVGLPEVMANCCSGWGKRQKVSDWIDRLLPELALIDERVERLVSAAAFEDEALVDPDLCDIDDEFGVNRMYQAETAFILGIIAGAKMAGYSRAKLDKVADSAAKAIQ